MNNWKTTLTGALAAVFATLAASDAGALNAKTAIALVFASLVAYFAKDHDGPPGAESPGRVLEGRAPALLLLLGTLTLGTGCASISQHVTSETAPDGSERRAVIVHVTAVGDAKQAIEKLTASSGNTLSAGASGASQETKSPDLSAFLIEILKQAAKKSAPP